MTLFIHIKLHSNGNTFYGKVVTVDRTVYEHTYDNVSRFHMLPWKVDAGPSLDIVRATIHRAIWKHT